MTLDGEFCASDAGKLMWKLSPAGEKGIGAVHNTYPQDRP
jgi:hypothetical protein